MTEAAIEPRPRRVEIGLWLSQGWEWFAEDWPTHIAIGFFALLLLWVGNVFLVGPVLAGLAIASLRKARGGKAELGDFFDGFRYFVWAFLASLLIGFFGLVGLVLCIVPGLVIFAMYMLTFHFIVDEDKDLWQAMESSRKVAAQDYFGYTLFLLLLCLLNLLGLMFIGIGMIVSLPVTSLALTAAYLNALDTIPAPSSSSPPPSPPIRIE